jgi:hypothetical protein
VSLVVEGVLAQPIAILLETGIGAQQKDDREIRAETHAIPAEAWGLLESAAKRGSTLPT